MKTGVQIICKDLKMLDSGFRRNDGKTKIQTFYEIIMIEEPMRVAIPIFGARISPRFDFAPSLLLLTLEKGTVKAREEVSLSPWNPWRRVEKLKEFEVQTLICGGIDCHSRQMLEDNRIRVIPWVAGEAEEALHLFLNGNLRPGSTLWPGCRRGRKRKMGSSEPGEKF